jgi:non-specific serine/threonine protein kinase
METTMVMAESSADGSPRYRMLETLRQNAQERLATQRAGAFDALRARHTNYYIALAEKVALEMFGPDQPKWSDRLDVEHDNIRAGLEWGKAADASPERVELVLRLAAPLFLAWFRRGYGREERQHFETLLAHPNGRRPTRARAQVLYAAGSLTFWQDGDAGASPQLDESLAMAEFLGDTRVMANARHSLGVVSYFRGDLAGARRHHEEALRLTRADGDLSGIRISLEDLSDVTADEGDPVRAAELQEEALALARQIGDQHGLASVLQSMGSLAGATGKAGRARELMGEGLNIMQRIGCLNCSARYLGDLASLASSSGEPYRAGRLLGAADALRERTGIVMRANAAGALEKTLVKTRQQLGEAAFSTAWNEGREMSLVQVSRSPACARADRRSAPWPRLARKSA